MSGIEAIFSLFVLGAGLFVGLILFVGYISGIRHNRKFNDSRSGRNVSFKPRAKNANRFLSAPHTPHGFEINTRNWSIFLLREIEWKRFEEVVVAFLSELGLKVTETTFGADGGIDFEVHDPTTGKVSMVGQCKAWPNRPVGVAPVRELFGVRHAESIPEASFFTTGYFTEEATRFAEKNGIDLFDGERLLKEIETLSSESRQRLLQIATEGDFRTPTCPQCGEKMVERKSGDRPSFWGCPKYPRCRGKLSKRS